MNNSLQLIDLYVSLLCTQQQPDPASESHLALWVGAHILIILRNITTNNVSCFLSTVFIYIAPACVDHIKLVELL